MRLVHRLPWLRAAVAEGIAGRRDAVHRWVSWATIHRTDAPLVWFHAASVGEALTAVPVMTRLRAARPVQIILTYSSPSMARWPWTWPAACTDYVPVEEPEPLNQAFDALRPQLLCFSRGDLWPELVATAQARGLPVAIIGGRMRPASQRRRWTGRLLLGEIHGSLKHVGAASEADRGRWIDAGVPSDRVVVTGDPRDDWTLERVVDPAPARTLRGWRRGCPVLVAGSLEADDLPFLARALAQLRFAVPDLRVLAVPHEPSDAAAALARMRAAGLEAELWSDSPEAPPEARVLVATQLGSLADLYLAADVAYVGGGFRRGRLHATAEAAAFGLPLLVGPGGEGTCGATVLPVERAVETFVRVVQRWVRDPTARATAGLLARRGLVPGAASRETGHLLELLERT